MRTPVVKRGGGTGGSDEPSRGRRERWQAHRQARREELVTAAIEAIRGHGAGVGMDEIAAQAGISKPILYRHFTDRADLWLAVAQKVTAELLEAMAQKLTLERSPRETIASVIDTYLALIEDDTEIYRFIVRGSFADRGMTSDLVHAHMALMAEHVARLLGDGLRAAGVDSGGAEPWAHGIVGMVQAAADWWIDRRSMSRAALVEYLTTLISTGVEGLLGGSLGAAAGGVSLTVHSAVP